MSNELQATQDLGIKLTGARVLIKEDVSSEFASADSKIVIAGKKSDPTFRGTILKVGPGAMLENAVVVPVDVKVGEKVMYTNWSGIPVVVNNETYYILNERDIICVIED